MAPATSADATKACSIPHVVYCRATQVRRLIDAIEEGVGGVAAIEPSGAAGQGFKLGIGDVGG
jgi:hypothetical protein